MIAALQHRCRFRGIDLASQHSDTTHIQPQDAWRNVA